MLFYFVTGGYSYCQLYKYEGQDTVIQVSLFDSTILRANKMLVLFESDTFIVLTTSKYLSSTVGKKFEWLMPDNEIYGRRKTIYNILVHRKSSSLKHDSILHSVEYKQAFQYLIADLLGEGGCMIFNKHTHRLERNIICKYYIHLKKKTMREGATNGREFYIGNDMMYTVEDGIYN